MSTFISDGHSTDAAAMRDPCPGPCRGQRSREVPVPWAFALKPPLHTQPEVHALTPKPGTAKSG